MQRPTQVAKASSSRSLVCEKAPTRAIEAAAPTTVARKRKLAFSSACPRVGTARMATQTAAEDAASSCNQKAAYKATTMAIQIRNANAQEAMGRPAKRGGPRTVVLLTGRYDPPSHHASVSKICS